MNSNTYLVLVRTLIKRHGCSSEVAKDALHTAFCSVDNSFSEGEKCAYILKVGSFLVRKHYQLMYVDKDSSVKRLINIDECQPPKAPEDEYKFLSGFTPLTKEFAYHLSSGKGDFTIGSIAHWLKSRKHINNRTQPREIYREIEQRYKRY